MSERNWTSLSEEEVRLLERYTSRSISREERRELEQRILANPALSEVLYADEALRAFLEESAEPRVIPIEESRKRQRGDAGRFLRIAIPIAAGALLIVMTPRFFRDAGPNEPKVSPEEGERRLRSPAPPPKSTATIIGLFPLGTFSSPPPKFTWTRDAQASAYRLELLDESGARLFSTETADTTFVLPPEHPAWKSLDSWQVVPLVGNSSGAPSNPVRVRIEPSGP